MIVWLPDFPVWGRGGMAPWPPPLATPQIKIKTWSCAKSRVNVNEKNHRIKVSKETFEERRAP